ncbi:MAG: glycosyl hydrolase family 28-related protein, partial [Terracidiphilus sp.]
MIRLKTSAIRRVSAPALALFCIAASAGLLHAARTCDPRSFGAKGDGLSKDTVAIQSAIDACAAQGGGTVRVTAGRYVSAPIVLKSNITLHLDKGATLLGSPDHGDYPDKIEFRLPAV